MVSRRMKELPSREMQVELSNEITVTVDETDDQATFPELLAVIDKMA